jgi:hypothetical protein
MAEYKINSYTTQKLDSRTLTPKGRKRTMFSVVEKKYPFPNKSIFSWETIKDGFKSEQEAETFLADLKGEQNG